ncbi:MAG TPA: protein kinase [Kofleriaceae bacterium]|nr:protein kinase [Kofleriaceae bacterium]
MPEQVDAGEPLLAEDTRIGDFRIRGLLGEGAMGQVYLAQDVTLGRRVALKLIKRSAMQGDAVERFLAEARATASFNHPHIVTLHAVGEHEGRPYLALEYLDGESLRVRLAAGPLPMREALRCARAIAEAVAEAHRHDLVHADLKPENVVIPRDGRLRVVDFGLAKHAGSAGTTASGTAAYMSPERWRGSSPTGAMDVWAFGILLHELIVGRRPLSDMVLAQLPFGSGPIDLLSFPDEPWAELVHECLSRDPAARPTADELVRRITALLDPRAATAEGADRCPFPGLAAFTRADAADYFGRRAELDALTEQLRTRALIPIVGPSGIGKSSFIRAALLPRLDETGRWVALSLRPGAAPFEALADVLALPQRPDRSGRSARPPAAIAASLRRYPDSLSLFLADAAEHHGARVLLFIDQFEEAFTLAADPAEAIAFCDRLARAASADEPWRIVLTVRDDFLGRLAAAPAMRPHLGAVMLLGPLAPDDLRNAIAGPLAHADYEPDDPALITRIVDDVAGQPACLPLLQFTCQSLWERRDRQARHILTAEYEAMGGATGALAKHAQRFMAELAADEVRIVRAILLALVHPDGTRRPRLRGELLEALPEAARGTGERLLDRLLDRRLVVAARDAEQDAATLEVAHEALATAWPQLARWLDETYEERVIVAELEQASQLWQRRGQSDDATWGGGALDEAVRKVDQWNITLPSVSRAFLDASVQRARRLARGRRRRNGAIVGSLAAVAVAAGIAAWAFARKEAQAIAQREELARKNAEVTEKNAELARAAADLGDLRLELEPFDWDPVRRVRLQPRVQPVLQWQIYGTALNNPQELGHKYEDSSLQRRRPPRWESGVLIEEVAVRSGPAFLVIDRGNDCELSILFLKRLPGYSDRVTKRMQILVPTCQASRAGMIEIPAGEFYRSIERGEGELVDVPKYEPGYLIDQTEVTRAAFALFESMQDLTGMRSPPADYLAPNTTDRGALPVSGLNHATARSYCRYMGKDLPSSDQWQKAFRGGRVIDGKPNPFPQRVTPWSSARESRPTNLIPNKEDHGAPAPVGTYPDDVSPYRIYDLAGNVSEWSRQSARKMNGMYRAHGGNWDSPAGNGYEKITWTNTRPAEAIDYAIGVRCVAAP